MKRSDQDCASSKRSDRDCASCQIQVPDSSFRPCFKNQIPDSRFRTTKASAYSRFQIPGTGFRRPHMPVQIPVSKSPVQGLVDPGTDSRFQFPESQFPERTNTDSSFQIPRAISGGPCTPVQIPDFRLQRLVRQSDTQKTESRFHVSTLGPVSRFQLYPDYRIQGGWRGRSGRGRLQIQIRRFWGGRGGAGAQKSRVQIPEYGLH